MAQSVKDLHTSIRTGVCSSALKSNNDNNKTGQTSLCLIPVLGRWRQGIPGACWADSPD